MQTYSLSKSLVGPLIFFAAMAALPSAGAQTLARPGWAGSGMSPDPWWRSGVLYQVTAADFQDSDGDGVGDLRGVADRMDYLQTLGVDALVLEQPASNAGSDAGFDDLISAAGQRHLRVVMTIEDGADAQAQPESAVVALARMWLTRGAAGILLESKQSAADAAPLLHRLRALTDSFPGNRVLLAATATNPAPSTVHAISIDEDQPAAKTRHSGMKQAAGAQLTEVPLELTNATAKTIRGALNGVNGSTGQSDLFLNERLFSTQALLDPANVASLDGRRRAFALVLLASRGSAELHYGQEIGILSAIAMSPEQKPLMQWTASNITPAVKVKEDVAVPMAVKRETVPEVKDADGYGPFHPYVPPPKNTAPAPNMPQAVPGGAPPAVDPDSLPGFTTGRLPVALPALDAKRMNVAHEDADPDSLLNLYRRLIELHHDNPALRSGPEMLLDYDDLDAVVWVRQPPRGSATTTAIIAVCNLSAAPLHLSLNQELTKQHVHTGSLRDLLSTQASQFSVQSTDNLTLPPYGIFLGELYH